MDIKMEAEYGNVVVKQELDIEYSPLPWESVPGPDLKAEDQVDEGIVKQEFGEAIVKQEVDIGPAVLQSPTTPRTQAGSRSSLGGVSEGGASSTPSCTKTHSCDQDFKLDRATLRTDLVEDSCKSNNRVTYYQNLVMYVKRTENHLTVPRECYECPDSEDTSLVTEDEDRCQYGATSLAQCDPLMGTMRSLSSTCAIQKQYGCDQFGYHASKPDELKRHMNLNTGSDTDSEYKSGAPGPSTKKKLLAEIVHKKCVTTYTGQDFTPSETQSTDNEYRRETIVKSCIQSPKEYGKHKRQRANKIPKTNSERQQQFRQKQKKIQKSESLESNLARKKNDAERSKRYRDRLKSRKQRGELDFVLSSKEHSSPTVSIENEEKTDQAVPRADAEDHYHGQDSGGLSEVGSVSGARTDIDRGAVAPEQCHAGAEARESARPARGSATEFACGKDGPDAAANRNTDRGLYECDYCKRTTTQKYSLISHICIHTGNKPYKCKLCEYSTSYSGNLTQHMRTHTGDKPYKCKLCEYSASQISHLKLHMCTHTGDKPNKCMLSE